MKNNEKNHLVDQAQYALQLLSHSYFALNKIIPKSEKEDSTGVLVIRLLHWIAATLDSQDAFLLSWPDARGQMQIQKPAYINTPALKEREALACFDELHQWIDSDVEDWALGDTSGTPELYNVGIESCIVTKVLTSEEDGLGFRREELLMICNRSFSALEENRYVGYDRLFCGIAQFVLKLHISEIYNLVYKRYKDARERYKDSKSVSSLVLMGETAADLLDFYSRYRAKPPLPLLYDCLDAYIALFSAGQKDKNELIEVLKDCKEHWLPKAHESHSKDLDPVRCALARGYFALGIDEEKEGYWAEGKKLLRMTDCKGA